MKSKLLTPSVLLLLLLTAGVSQSKGDVIATRTRVFADTFSDGATHFVPLNNAGSTAMVFITTVDNQRVVISYNAECSVKASTNFTWLNVDVLVDGIAASPSSDDNAFCTDHGNNLLGNWVSAVTTVVAVLPEPGFHVIQVRGNLVGWVPGNLWRLDDSSTIVMQ